MIPMTEKEDEDMNLLRHQAAVGRNWRTVSAIKDWLSADDPDLYAVAEAWYELSQEEQRLLWRAPRKGGCFTTEERSIIKSHLPNLFKSE